jgi:predicted GTPase
MQEKLETIVTKYNNIIGNESKNLVAEYAIQSSVKTKEAFQKIEDENRLLQIGIIGRVKAGKSSLLNAILFDGKSILPKAATPMTAALTIISYGEELSSEVEFFTQNDINNIKAEHKNYTNELKHLTDKKLEEQKKRREQKNSQEISNDERDDLRKKAEIQAIRELKSKISLSSSYDQYNKIKASGIDCTTLGEKKIIAAPTLVDLSQQLLDYVGADGNYMPFTKSVHIKLPLENLKNIQIVDTPGVNDPVQSREERTRELLKFCDAVLIVSPSGQFMSNEDMELMDRITSKEGIRELYVIASQVDLQLFGSVKSQNDGDLHRASKAITSDLADHLYSTLSNLKKSNPEVGTTYDQLIEQSKTKVIHSSGMCLSIKEMFDAQETWDEGTKKAWENLSTHYPDYFSNTDKELTKSNLDLLANIASINTIIEEVKAKKDVILNQRKNNFIKAKSDALQKYKNELITYANSQIESIKNGDIDDLKAQQRKLTNIKEKVSTILDEEYHDFVDELERDIKNKLSKVLEGYFKSTNNRVDTAQETKTELYKERTERLGGWWFDKVETKSKEVTTVRSGAVRSALEELISDIESSTDFELKQFISEWRKSLAQQLVRSLREHIEDDHLDPHQIQKVIRNIINSIPYPDITYTDNMPSSLSAKGTLKESDAEDFLEEAKEYISKLRTRVRNDINSFATSLDKVLKAVTLSEAIFSNYTSMLEELENQIKNKAVMLDSYDRLKKDLAEVA